MSNNKTSDFNRRDFLKTGFLVTGSMVLGAAAGTAKAAAGSRMSDRVLSDPPVSEGQRILGSGKSFRSRIRLYGTELSPRRTPRKKRTD